MTRTIRPIMRGVSSVPKLKRRTEPQTMKAVRIHNYGGPEVLQYEDAPRPKPAAGEVLIRVHAAGINPADWKAREGHLKQFAEHKFPLILGWDVSGVVEEIGPGPATAGQFKRGDQVYGKLDPKRDGAYAEYVVARTSEITLKPKSLHHVQAAAVPITGLTAWRSLFNAGQLRRGQRVLIHGGSGGVGHFAVQLAKWKGAHVLATASTENQAMLRELGVDEPIDYTKQKFDEIARDVDLVLDTIGGETQECSLRVLKRGGLLVSVAQPPSADKAKALGVRATFVWSQSSSNQLAEIRKLIDSGKLKLTLDRILPLSEARRAHELSESGHVRGKIVLRVKDAQP
jgi:NADPH:quinone reductase-like Zn-dependent oxidoreductase